METDILHTWIAAAEAEFIDVRTADGQLAFRIAPSSGIVEWRHKDRVFYINLVTILQQHRGRNGQVHPGTAVYQ